jgi:pimeloyl-ACP methyl ester carboxylesterase
MAIPGVLIEVNKRRLLTRPMGSGEPAVIFDAALGASSLSWSLVQPEVARHVLTFSYDRAGFGGSDAGPMPRTISRIAGELRELLAAAGVPGPFVLVGHSFGGLCARAFAGRYREDTAGLVLVDAPHPSQWMNPTAADAWRLRTGVRLARRGAFAARIGLARAVSWLVRAGTPNAARRMSFSLGGPALRGRADYFLGTLSKLPAEARAEAVAAWMRPQFYEALASQMESMPQSAREAAAVGDLGAMPLAVVTAAEPSDRRLAEQQDTLRLSTRSRHWVARRGGHWIPLDDPSTVVEAIAAVVDQARR